MIENFINQDPAIYLPSYKYEKSPVMLKLAIEKYFITWLSSHWQTLNHLYIDFPLEEQKRIQNVFAGVFLKLLNKWSIVNTTDPNQVNLGINLVKDMSQALHQFLNAGENASAMNNILEIALEKNRVIFDRKIKQLSEDE